MALSLLLGRKIFNLTCAITLKFASYSFYSPSFSSYNHLLQNMGVDLEFSYVNCDTSNCRYVHQLVNFLSSRSKWLLILTKFTFIHFPYKKSTLSSNFVKCSLNTDRASTAGARKSCLLKHLAFVGCNFARFKRRYPGDLKMTIFLLDLCQTCLHISSLRYSFVDELLR